MKLEELTALYSPLDIEYSQVMSGPYEDISYHGEDCTIIAGLKDGRISGFWRPVVAVGDDKSLKLHIERLYDICQNIYYMDFLIDGKLSVISQFLLRYGHKARPYYTQIIDLTKGEEELHADLRKSYRGLINSQMKKWEVVTLDCHSIYKYQKGHQSFKGNTRNSESWKIQFRMCAFGDAIVFNNPDNSSGCMFYFNKKSCYYFSAYGENVHHIIWRIIKYIKKKKPECKFIEMGEQVFSGDPKLVNISKFKRGFGGTTQTRLIIEKGNNG